ncbi:hypothetical protein [Cesiribacter sp. SM1]|uniref:hypothetical protein n=1 Tax=Cesiribacter sp. SM1 TaxID=2861196 RepID=UPI001CD7658D|nr:hypothetical protein [Cesiribacter sp. SM1]
MGEEKMILNGRTSVWPPWNGTLINYMGLSKINTRGILSADKKMLMAAAAYNLKKWINFCSITRPPERTKNSRFGSPCSGCAGCFL